MNKTDLQNLLFNVRHGNVSVEDASSKISDSFLCQDLKTVIGDNKTVYTPEPKKEVWELYPDYRSCLKEGLTFYCYDYFYGSVKDFVIERENLDKIYCTSLKLAKRQLAELQLAKIADKWGEGVEAGEYIWKPICNNGGKLSIDMMPKNSFYFNTMPFYFKTKKQLEKSIELHQQLWKDWFMID